MLAMPWVPATLLGHPLQAWQQPVESRTFMLIDNRETKSIDTHYMLADVGLPDLAYAATQYLEAAVHNNILEYLCK